MSAFPVRRRSAAAALVLTGVVTLSGVLAAPADAAAAKTYKNCTALTKVYPHGVANKNFTTAQWKARGATGKPAYKKAVYAANTKSDRDKDGIACER